MKLIRDKIPEIIEQAGKWCLCRRVCGKDEHIVMLQKKMTEEIDELIHDPSYEEAADVFEVLREFAHIYDLEMDEIQRIADDKRKERGGFSKGIILQDIGDSDERR
jgi:predicted house-cleaning noncanonical NTP pyrophosphatase (MazG superfamily)